MASIRTFIAFDTPQSMKEEISRIQNLLKETRADVKWETEKKFHVTIKFLGNVEENNLSNMLNTVKGRVLDHHSFSVIYETIGSFPNTRHPRVLWVGCTNPDEELIGIKNDLDGALAPYGFKIENRRFHPHVTLGRVRSESGIKNLIQKMENITFQPRQVSITEILVVKSVLKPNGSEYTTLMTIPLKE